MSCAKCRQTAANNGALRDRVDDLAVELGANRVMIDYLKRQHKASIEDAEDFCQIARKLAAEVYEYWTHGAHGIGDDEAIEAIIKWARGEK